MNKAKTMWVSILREWYVLSETAFKIGEKVEVEKRDGTKTEEIVEDIVGMFMNSTIYKMERKEDKTQSLWRKEK